MNSDKFRLYIFIFMIVGYILFLWTDRYEINNDGAVGFKLDKWTGSAYLLRGNVSKKVR